MIVHTRNSKTYSTSDLNLVVGVAPVGVVVSLLLSVLLVARQVGDLCPRVAVKVGRLLRLWLIELSRRQLAQTLTGVPDLEDDSFSSFRTAESDEEQEDTATGPRRMPVAKNPHASSSSAKK